jgi:hypothetical protein
MLQMLTTDCWMLSCLECELEAVDRRVLVDAPPPATCSQRLPISEPSSWATSGGALRESVYSGTRRYDFKKSACVRNLAIKGTPTPRQSVHVMGTDQAAALVTILVPITNYQLPNGLIKVRRRWGQRHPQGANSGSNGKLKLMLNNSKHLPPAHPYPMLANVYQASPFRPAMC